MRIVHLVDRPDAIGGVSTYLAGLLPALREHGVEGVVFTADASLTTFAGAPCVHVPAVAADTASLDPAERRKLLDALGAAGADLAYAHVTRSPDIVVAAAERLPTVFYAHDYYAVCPGSMRYLHRSERLCEEGAGLRCFWRAYTERTTSRRPDRLLRSYRRVVAWRDAWPRLARVLVASPFVADLLAGDGVPRELLRVVPYFVGPAIAPPAPVEQDVLFLGRLVEAKGAHVLIEALARTEGATAAIAGDGPARPALERLAEKLGLGARVRFLGWTPQSEGPRLLAASRVVAVPSLWDEPFGIAGIEALAAGVPVVASAVGGIPSWLRDGEGGLLVPRGDAAALADALRRLLGDEQYRLDQAARARAAALSFSLERHLDLLLPELRAVAEAR